MSTDVLAAQRAAGRSVEYQRNAVAAYRTGRYLESSQWTRLAEYERDRAGALARRLVCECSCHATDSCDECGSWCWR